MTRLRTIAVCFLLLLTVLHYASAQSPSNFIFIGTDIATELSRDYPSVTIIASFGVLPSASIGSASITWSIIGTPRTSPTNPIFIGPVTSTVPTSNLEYIDIDQPDGATVQYVLVQGTVTYSGQPADDRYVMNLSATLTVNGTSVAQLASTSQSLVVLKSKTRVQRQNQAITTANSAIALTAPYNDTNMSFTVQSSEADKFGLSHVHYTQFFKGLKVFNGELIIETDDVGGGIWKKLNYAFKSVPSSLGATPAISISDAISIAAADTPVNSPVDRTAELVIYEDSEAHYILAYHVTSTCQDPDDFMLAHHIIDGNTGAIIAKWFNNFAVCTPSCNGTNCVGKGQTQYRGCKLINTKKNGSIYELRDHAHSLSPVYNADRHVYPATGTLYTDSDNIWGDSTHINESDPTTGERGKTDAADAAFAHLKAWDYFKLIHSRNGHDGSGGLTTIVVHSKQPSGGGGNHPKDPGHFQPPFGAWFNNQLFVSDNAATVDIVGHEYTHGIHLGLNRLVDHSGETGALAEATADIFGTMVEFYTNASGANWLIAEQVGAIRSLEKPSTFDLGIDFYDSGVPNAEVHRGAGVGDHFFYYLVKGVPTSGSNSSPYLPEGMMPGMNRLDAEEMYYDALKNNMGQHTNYRQARIACLAAADDLEFHGDIPAGSRDKVKKAWKAVNIPPQPEEDDDCRICQ